MIFKEKTKPLPISKDMVWEAYKLVKRNGGSSGVDKQSLEIFEGSRVRELYKLWNRMSSGSYLASAVKRVSIDKGNGESRPLGIPTVSDRIAQQVVKTYLEPRLEAVFLSSSYGYRPKKSGHQAIAQVRNYVRKYPWVIDLDIKGFFDNVDHDLLMKALDKHVSEKWVKMYIKRWLEAPVQLVNGDYLFPDGKGIPQGGVISPLLSNLFLHYSIDKWMEINYPSVDMVRYADDIVIHCQTHQEAKCLLNSLKERLTTCRLEVHRSKTKIVYCKKEGRYLEYKSVQFDFLGFSFQPLRFHLKKGGSFLQYDCKMSRKSKKRILARLRSLKLDNRTRSTLQDLAQILNPKIRGWINYYGKVSCNSLKPIFYYLHHRLLKWVMKKFKGHKNSRVRSVKWLRQCRKDFPNLFYHWSLGYHLT